MKRKSSELCDASPVLVNGLKQTLKTWMFRCAKQTRYQAPVAPYFVESDCELCGDFLNTCTNRGCFCTRFCRVSVRAELTNSKPTNQPTMEQRSSSAADGSPGSQKFSLIKRIRMFNTFFTTACDLPLS
jgi:hypothetical protein